MKGICSDIKRQETKEQIYAGFGIPYDNKSGKIFHHVYGWINPLLVNGNEKIGKGAWHFSMLHGNETYHLNIALKTVETVIKKSKDPANIGKKKTVVVVDNENQKTGVVRCSHAQRNRGTQGIFLH